MQKASNFALPFAAVFGALAMSLAAGQASAYTINAGSPGILGTDYWVCNDPNNKGTLALIEGCFTGGAGFVNLPDTLDLLYKSDFGGSDGGDYPDSYNTVFSQFDGDNEPSSATITWVTGKAYIDCPACFLLVKDGVKGNPAHYLFDIGDWNGTDQISLINFWPGDEVKGAISNVAIWGEKTKTPGNGGPPTGETPEPGVLFLMGAGLLGLGMARRRKSA